MTSGAHKSSDRDTGVRVEAFKWLHDQVAALGDVVSIDLLRQGFIHEGNRVPLMGPQGIFKPAVLPELPLSITTAPDGPYDDAFTSGGLLSYRYRGSDPDHRDNVGLRSAMKRHTPLVYFHGVAKSRYLAVWPVFIVGDDPAHLAFLVAADDERLAESAARNAGQVVSEVHEAEGRRAYITATGPGSAPPARVQRAGPAGLS